MPSRGNKGGQVGFAKTCLFSCAGFAIRNFPPLVADGQVAQLVAHTKYVVADAEVDDGRQDAARPDGEIVEPDPELVVSIVNPTPQLRTTRVSDE